MRLDEKLKEYSKKDVYPFHMPGHKRRLFPMETENFMKMDITEIEGFDNLHHARGILKEAQIRAARLFKARTSFYCINGSSAALLAAISASLPRGGTLLVARNCHKSVYHGIYLRGLRCSYLYPKREKRYGLNGGICPEDVEDAIKKNPQIGAVLITSPTYDGVISDIEAIGKITKKYQKILIVDEAHGAHFSLSEYSPLSAGELGADLLVKSIHKTLPSMTQTALLCRISDKISEERLQYFMSVYQTSSPSYLLMASMDACIGWIEDKGEKAFKEFYKNLREFRLRLGQLKHIKLVGKEIIKKSAVCDYDESKVVLSLRKSNLSGPQLAEILIKDYHICPEMAAQDYLLLLTSVADDKEGFLRAAEALKKIDQDMERGESKALPLKEERPVCKRTIEEAVEEEGEKIPFNKAAGRISKEFIYAYPPGTPLLVPGEEITERLIKEVEEKIKLGLDMEGLRDYNNEYIFVLKERDYGKGILPNGEERIG